MSLETNPDPDPIHKTSPKVNPVQHAEKGTRAKVLRDGKPLFVVLMETIACLTNESRSNFGLSLEFLRHTRTSHVDCVVLLKIPLSLNVVRNKKKTSSSHHQLSLNINLKLAVIGWSDGPRHTWRHLSFPKPGSWRNKNCCLLCANLRTY